MPSNRRLSEWTFSLRGLFVVTTLSGILVFLFKTNVDLGANCTAVLLGSIFATLMVRRRQFFGAFCTVAFTSGVISRLAASLPISPVGFHLADLGPNWILTGYFCVSSLAAALLIRWCSPDAQEINALNVAAFLYSQSTLIVVFVNLGPNISPSWRALVTLSPLGLLCTFILVSLSFYVTIPAVMIALRLTQTVSEIEFNSDHNDSEVLRAVENLNRNGRINVFLDDILMIVALDEPTTIECVQRLRLAGKLEFTERGYRR